MAGKKTGLSKAQIKQSLLVRYDSFGSTRPWKTGAEKARMRRRAEIDQMPLPPREPAKIGNIVDCGSKEAQDRWNNTINRSLLIEQAKFIRTLTGYCGELQYYRWPH